MVAVITTSHSIHRILNYNENKVKQEKALCVAAVNYPSDASSLSFTMKLRRFEKLMELNANAKRNSVHISLNFDVSEKDMPSERMEQIAQAYMDQIGFGSQPYLVYRHFDAGHPHIHLVTTNIEANGSRIDLHHLAIRRSEPARKAIELAFGLVQAQAGKKTADPLARSSAAKVAYGIPQTRAAIQKVLDATLDKYRFTSLAELNAVLQLYNVRADQGSEGSRLRRHGGLLYRILDDKGNAVGVPIKASLFYSRPTLAKLTLKFSRNSILGQQHKARIRYAIDRLPQDRSLAGLRGVQERLAREGISLVQRESSDGQVYGITYIDHQTGGVFNGSALGRQYSAKQMQERFPAHSQDGSRKSMGAPVAGAAGLAASLGSIAIAEPALASLAEEIIRIAREVSMPAPAMDFVPGQLKKKRSKKRKRGPSTNN